MSHKSLSKLNKKKCNTNDAYIEIDSWTQNDEKSTLADEKREMHYYAGCVFDAHSIPWPKNVRVQGMKNYFFFVISLVAKIKCVPIEQKKVYIYFVLPCFFLSSSHAYRQPSSLNAFEFLTFIISLCLFFLPVCHWTAWLMQTHNTKYIRFSLLLS